MRRHAGVDLGERYQMVLAFGGEGDHGMPDLWERTLGDVLDPLRPGGGMAVVNEVSRDVGRDVAGWRWDRVLGLYASMVREARERARQRE